MKCANPACGKDLDPGEKFCGYCGTDVPKAAEEIRAGLVLDHHL